MAEGNPKLSLLNALKSKGYTSSILTTYNANFRLYEQVVLPRLTAAGVTHNVVLVDARMFAECLGSPSTQPKRAGRDYTLIPVQMGGAFHPKALMRVSKTKGSLFVGSHNLTVSGFGVNRELTNHFEYNKLLGKAEVPPFRVVASLIRDYVTGREPAIVEAVEAALSSAPWLKTLHAAPERLHVLGGSRQSASLWAQMRGLIAKPVRRVLVVSPFFGTRLSFLERLLEDWEPEKLVIAIDPDRVEIPSERARKITQARFVNIKGMSPDIGTRKKAEPYLHAKALYIESENGPWLVTGSANASYAAFLAKPSRRNAEVIAARSDQDVAQVAEALGLGRFWSAPEIQESEWVSISTRLAEQPPEDDQDSASVVQACIAVVTDVGLQIDIDLRGATRVAVCDVCGAELGAATVSEVGPPALIVCDDALLARAAFLLYVRDGVEYRSLIHHPKVIAEHYVSDTRRALRAALGSLDEDPSQLETLLKLSEQVLFEENNNADGGEYPRRRRSGESSEGTQEHSPQPESLLIDARGRTSRRSQKRVVKGDLAALLDALIRRLGEGLESQDTERLLAEEEDADTDISDVPPPPSPREIPNASRLARSCRRKVNRLLSKMTEHIAFTGPRQNPRQTVGRLAVVLSLLRALATIQQGQEWKRARETLIEAESVWDFFKSTAPRMCVGEDALVPMATEGHDSERFDELSIALGHLMWLAWFSEIDVSYAARNGGKVGVEEELWPWVQYLAYLAPWITDDKRAQEIAKEATRSMLFHGAGSECWLRYHLEWLEWVALFELDPDDVESITRSPMPGDLVVLPQDDSIGPPRVRVVVRTEHSNRGLQVQVEDTQKGTRTFTTKHLKLVDSAGVMHREQAG